MLKVDEINKRNVWENIGVSGRRKTNDWINENVYGMRATRCLSTNV